MRVVMFYHSLVSDWNHGNAHFLRGIASELLSRGCDVVIFEPEDAWSVEQLVRDQGSTPLDRFHAAYPGLRSRRYDPRNFDVREALRGADLVIVHEWNPPRLVAAIGEHHKSHPSYVLLFHDTHHRMVTQPEQMSACDLSGYDGVLAYGNVLRDLYLSRGLARRAWTWHEAADVRRFAPQPGVQPDADLVWIGNWGDDERSRELHEFIIEPVRALGLRARFHGVRYPAEARRALDSAGIEYAGWLPNFEVPAVFARHRVTVHVPRRPYVEALPGIPTIRPFEALACGIPLVCAPWRDSEGLFTAGRDYLGARDGAEMTEYLARLVRSREARDTLAAHGLRTVRTRHTCAHRVGELFAIAHDVRRSNPARRRVILAGDPAPALARDIAVVESTRNTSQGVENVT